MLPFFLYILDSVQVLLYLVLLNMIVNYPEMSIHIKPNKYYFDPFDYSYTGLAFYLINGEVKVEDIMQGSPAEKAGFMPGDIIFSVDKTISKDIKTYRNIFQNSLGLWGD